VNARGKPKYLMEFVLKTPVLFLIFNRPSTTKVVFEAIRKARPSKLYIAADGPRKNKPGEVEKCNEARAIASNVDWECEVKTLFREQNLGCGKGVSNGITWFFQHEPEGIILEDDCLPNESFFPYCAELLERYRHDSRIMEVSGNNIRPEKYCKGEYSYSFSDHNGIWGWASWRRAWNLYDYEMKQYRNVRKNQCLKDNFNSIFEKHYFQWVFERTYLFPHITWDYQWEFVKRINSGLTIVPKKNMVINIGFGADATSTTNLDTPSSNLKAELLEFPLRHPPYVISDKEADKYAFITHMTTKKSRLKSRIKNMLPESIQNRIFRYTMTKFIESQEADQSALQQLKQKSTLKMFSSMNLFMYWGELEVDIELIFLPLLGLL
jgi:hypothetical protein